MRKPALALGLGLLAILALGTLWISSGDVRRSARRSAARDATPAAAAPAEDLRAVAREAAVEREALDAAAHGTRGAAASGERTPLDPEDTRVLLHVRDGVSGRALAPVLVAEYERWLDPALERPPGERAEELGASPVRLPAPFEGEVHTVFARSPGYAWGRIELGSRQHERVLELEPGGELRVRVTGGPRDPGTVVRVLAGEGRLLAELELQAAEELLLAGLPEGPVEVVAQIGAERASRELVRESAAIVARTTADVTLVLPPVGAARWVPLAGSLVLPPEWALDEFQLVFRLQGPALERWPGRALVDRVEMTLVERETGLLLWDAREVQPGVYTVALAEAGWECVIVVGGLGTRELRLAVPPPCAVRLRPLEEGTRAPAGQVGLQRSSGPDDVPITGAVTGWNEELGAFEFRAPQGRMRVAAGTLGRAWTFELRPGTNELELELPPGPATGVLLSLADEHGPVPWDLRRIPALQAFGGSAEPPGWSLDERGLVLRVAAPGSYRLSVPPLAGYEPVPERVLELEAGALAELAIQLVRRR